MYTGLLFIPSTLLQVLYWYTGSCNRTPTGLVGVLLAERQKNPDLARTQTSTITAYQYFSLLNVCLQYTTSQYYDSIIHITRAVYTLVYFSNVHLISYVTGSRYFSWEILVQQGFRLGLRQGDSCQGKRLWYLESVHSLPDVCQYAVYKTYLISKIHAVYMLWYSTQSSAMNCM